MYWVVGSLIVLLLLEPGVWFFIDNQDIITYGDTYKKYRELPLIVAQIMGGLILLKYTMMIFSIVTIIMYRPNWHKYIIVFLVLLFLFGLVNGGSRSLFILPAFAYLVAYLLFVKPLKLPVLAAISIFFLILFSVAGILRSGGFDSEIFVLPLFQRGEFVNVFVNPIDLMHIKAESSNQLLDWRIYIVDLLGWVPQQILWFEKLNLSNWYVKVYYPDYYNLGGGLAFGAITESVIGHGILEAFVRGSLLGVCFAYVSNLCLSGKVDIIKALIYVWFVVFSYQSIRDTTFTFFPRFILYVFPILLVFYIIRKIYDIKNYDYNNNDLL